MLVTKYEVLKSFQRRCFLLGHFKIKYCSRKASDDKTSKFAFKALKDVEEGFLKDKFKAGNHPGIMNIKSVTLPSALLEAIEKVKEELGYPTSTLKKDGSQLWTQIHHRHPEPEKEDLNQALDAATANLILKGRLPADFADGKDGEVTVDDMTEEHRRTLAHTLKQHVYNWKPMEFTEYNAFVYLWVRLAPDYASLLQIFHEIQKRRKDFRPQSVFDFGSGVGSVLWAVDAMWPEGCNEIYNVDSSTAMNEISERLWKAADPSLAPFPTRSNTIYYRQYLPASDSLKYDLVVSSRTLFEIGNLKTRIRTVDILWKKVAPGGFLVLVEGGTKYGVRILLELRDYILEMSRLEREKYSLDSPAHVFSPCPHDKFCPRFDHRSSTPCHFFVKYESLTKNFNSEKFSYVVLQKEERKVEQDWPRIIQPVLKRHGHSIIRTCTPAGSIRELTATKARHGVPCFQLCRNSRWGDFMPIKLDNDWESENTFSDDVGSGEEATVEEEATSGEEVCPEGKVVSGGQTSIL